MLPHEHRVHIKLVIAVTTRSTYSAASLAKKIYVNEGKPIVLIKAVNRTTTPVAPVSQKRGNKCRVLERSN